jgi:hypothetical protein
MGAARGGPQLNEIATMDKAQERSLSQQVCRVRPDPIDLRDTPYRPSVANAPRLELFPQWWTPVKDQAGSNACTGFALAAAIEILLQRAERERAPQISSFMLYDMARRFDEVNGNDDVDLGSSVRGALKGWYRFGACAHALWPNEGMPAATNDPASDWWLDAVKRPLGAYYRVDPRNLGHMQAALTEAQVLYASAAWHEGWETGRGSSANGQVPRSFADIWEIPYDEQQGSADTGHAFAIVGYNARGFLVQNSWGAQWGTSGYALLTYRDWLANSMDCWVAQLGVPNMDHEAISRAPSLRYQRATGSVALASAPLLQQRELSPFIVDMENDGQLSRTGLFRTQDDDLRALVENHLPHAVEAWGLDAQQPIDLAIFAHGGINSENDAQEHAAYWIPKLYERQIFPAFLMWENDLWSSLRYIVQDRLRGEPLLTGAGAPRLRIPALPDLLTDLGTGKWANTRTERLISKPGLPVWEETRGNAITIGQSEQSGARKLIAYLRSSPFASRLRIHLIAHSAGAIVHSYLADAMVKAGMPIQSVVFMAHAARTADFDGFLLPHLKDGGVQRYLQFHLTDDQENADRECEPFYRRSLLFLVSEAFEGGAQRPMLGMERYFGSYGPVKAQHGITAYAAPCAQSRTVSHSGFARDPTTLATVLDYIKA